MSPPPSGSPAPMTDQRFMVLLIGALTAVLGIGVVVTAALGLQDPVYRDFDTGVVRNHSRTLACLVALGAVMLLGGAGTAVILFRLQMRGRH